MATPLSARGEKRAGLTVHNFTDIGLFGLVFVLTCSEVVF